MGGIWLWVSVMAATSLACGSNPSAPTRWVARPSAAGNLPDPTPAPECVQGALISLERVCGLGVAGRAFHWDDPSMRALAARRASRNLAGLMRAVVTTAQVLHETESSRFGQVEQYVEIDDSLVDAIQAAADVQWWFDVDGTGPFRSPHRTYACACLTAREANIRIDPDQAFVHAAARQYAVNEVPEWLREVGLQNDSLRCAVGFQERMFHPEEMLGPLTDQVRAQLTRQTRSYVLSEFSDETRCRTEDSACNSRITDLVKAANEGISRGVALTSVWFDSTGIGPREKPMSAYGWGCVFDGAGLEAARRHRQRMKSHSHVVQP